MTSSQGKTVTILGHPLAAEENRLAFKNWAALSTRLLIPQTWPSRSLGVTYHAPPLGGEGGLPCRFPGHNSLYTWRGLEPVLRENLPALIYCWEEPWCLSTFQSARIALRHGIPFVFYTAENRPKRLPFPFPFLMRFVFRHARACVAPTIGIADNIRRMGFTGEILPIPLWIRPRQALHPDFPRKTFAFLGRLIPLKRVDLLIRSLLQLPGFRLRVIGDGPERRPLERLAANLRVSDRVDFLGHMPNPDLEKALEGCGCVILPTAANEKQAEQFGKAVLESILCGLPALVTDSGELPKWAEQFGSVRRIATWSPEAVAEAVNALWAAPPKESTLSKARQEVESQYGPHAAGLRMEKAFSTLLETKP